MGCAGGVRVTCAISGHRAVRGRGVQDKGCSVRTGARAVHEFVRWGFRARIDLVLRRPWQLGTLDLSLSSPWLD